MCKDETIHPRKGTETFTWSSNMKTVRETIHPRKGTETYALRSLRWSNGETIHPRKGTETTYARAPLAISRYETIHPRKGTETSSIKCQFLFHRKQFIPARGRKRNANYTDVVCLRNNSSPQGDGNARAPRATSRYLSETIHPRKGTETIGNECQQSRGEGNNSSPQGDGNVISAPPKPTISRNNSSPQGDGNNSALISCMSSVETIHPRKGTETFAVEVHR